MRGYYDSFVNFCHFVSSMDPLQHIEQNEASWKKAVSCSKYKIVFEFLL